MVTASASSPLPSIRLAVEVEGLAKVFGSPSASVAALRGISMALPSGQRVALLGKSGSGKSTLLNLIGGLDRPTSGLIRVAGKELSRLTERELAGYRLATVGMIFQAYNLIPTRTAIENVELPMILAGRAPADRAPMRGRRSRRSDWVTGSCIGPSSFPEESFSGSRLPVPW